jgi:signal transduction histidine kinase
MKPAFKHGLTRNLILTYVLLTLLVGSALTLTSFWTVSALESHLQRIDMGMAVERVRNELFSGQDPGRINRFFHGKAGSEDIPEWLRGLSPGFHKIDHEDRFWHVMAEDYAGERYILLRDYTDYENNQRLSQWFFVSGLGASLLIAFILGSVTTRRVVQPIVRLATQVSDRSQQPANTNLADNYPENEIGQLAQAFDKTYNALEQALQREQLFTADVGHELRTPLMVIMSTCELLHEDTALTTEQRHQLTRIELAAHNMRSKLDVYLMLARGGNTVQTFPHTTIATIASSNEEVWKQRAARQGNTFEIKFDRTSNTIQDRLYPAPLLDGVMSNLMRNVFEHAGVDVHTVLTIGTDYFSVQDNGAGIAIDAQSDIFHPFTRGNTASASNLGLGLSIIQRICAHQGWLITLASEPGHGTLFHIDLSQAQQQHTLPDTPEVMQ